MFWLLLLSATLCSSVLLYFQRFKSSKGFTGKKLVQSWYIFSGLVSATSIIGILFSIIPKTTNIADNNSISISLGFLLVSLCLSIFGAVLHSISLLVKTKSASSLLELIHLPLSHYMVYIGGIGTLLSIGYLDLFQAELYSKSEMAFAPIFGILIGTCCAVSIIWSGYIKVSLLVAWVGLLVFVSSTTSFPALFSQPYATASFLTIFIACIILTIFLFASAFSETFRKKSRIFYPIGHPKNKKLR